MLDISLRKFREQLGFTHVRLGACKPAAWRAVANKFSHRPLGVVFHKYPEDKLTSLPSLYTLPYLRSEDQYSQAPEGAVAVCALQKGS